MNAFKCTISGLVTVSDCSYSVYCVHLVVAKDKKTQFEMYVKDGCN